MGDQVLSSSFNEHLCITGLLSAYHMIFAWRHMNFKVSHFTSHSTVCSKTYPGAQQRSNQSCIADFLSEWMIKFNSPFQTADIRVHVIHISCVFIIYTLESLSFLTQTTHTLQVTINLGKKYKKETQKVRAHNKSIDRDIGIASFG